MGRRGQGESAARLRPRGGGAVGVGVHARYAFYEALWSLLADKDYAQISVADIIRRVGCSRGAFYHHFDNKLDLLIHAYAAHTDETVKNLQRSVGDASTAEDAIVGDVVGLVRALPSTAVRAAVVLRAAAIHNPELRRAFRRDYDQKTKQAAVLIRRDQQRGVLRADVDPGELGRQVYEAAFGVYLIHFTTCDRGDLADRTERHLRRLFAAASQKTDSSAR